jgi:hypothetical protein
MFTHIAGRSYDIWYDFQRLLICRGDFHALIIQECFHASADRTLSFQEAAETTVRRLSMVGALDEKAATELDDLCEEKLAEYREQIKPAHKIPSALYAKRNYFAELEQALWRPELRKK